MSSRAGESSLVGQPGVAPALKVTLVAILASSLSISVFTFSAPGIGRRRRGAPGLVGVGLPMKWRRRP